MGKASILERDFKRVNHIFPKLILKEKGEGNMWIITGDIDICDSVGDFWKTFSIAIFIPDSYPYCAPILQETSKHIKRNEDWHISDDGTCCIDIEHKLLLYAKRGFNIFEFIKNKVYTYFANQIYKTESGDYAAGEYKHYFDGIKQFYSEELEIKSEKLALNILQKILSKKLPGRNEPCICGKKKFKYCHLKSVQLLQSLPIKRLKEDFVEYGKLVSKNEKSDSSKQR
jgi:hypothetical protein